MSPQQRETNEACNLTLMQKTDCDGLRIECAFTVEEAKYICGLDKEVLSSAYHIILTIIIIRIFFEYMHTKSINYILISDGTVPWIHT